MSFPPEACLIGAQKSGTTTLAYLLDQHPQVTVAKPKEPHFFTRNWDKGLDWYEEKFSASDDTVRVDASTTYSMASLSEPYKRGRQKIYEGVPGRVFSVNPNAKLIYLMRDPVERTYSGYWHDIRMGRKEENFRTAVMKDPSYLDISDYYGQLRLWLQFFPAESFLFVLFEDLRENPEHITKECWDFLKVDGESRLVQLDSVKNQSYQASWLGRKMNKIGVAYPTIRSALKSIAPKGIQKPLKTAKAGSKPIPKMKREDRDFLLEYFRHKNTDLAALTNQSLDKWQR